MPLGTGVAAARDRVNAVHNPERSLPPRYARGAGGVKEQHVVQCEAVAPGVARGAMLDAGWASRAGALADQTVFAWGRTEGEAIQRANGVRAAGEASGTRPQVVSAITGGSAAVVLERELFQYVGAVQSALSAIPFADDRCPSRLSLVPLFDATAELSSSLSRLLEARGGDRARPPASVLDALASFYGVLTAQDNELTRRNLPKTYAFHEAVELWIEIAYRRAPNALAKLGEVERRAAALATATASQFEAMARRDWCDRVDAWLADDPAHLAAAERFILKLLDEMPGIDPEVDERLARIAASPLLSEAVKSRSR